MKRIIKKLAMNIASNVLAPMNAHPVALTDKEALNALLQKLYPVFIDKELIRMGPDGDGGYLVPDDLTGIEACFSPGVDLVSGFEKDCANMGMKVFMADKSVKQPAESHELFHFSKKYVGVTTNEDFMTVDNWVNSSLTSSDSDLLLQIDIEGFEYETFLNMSDKLMGRFRIIVAEFHGLEQLWSRPFFELASRAFEKILQTHICVHIHPNNCSPVYNKSGLSIPPVSEFTFYRKDKVQHQTFVNSFPHRLDFDCKVNNPHFSLPDCWYKK